MWFKIDHSRLVNLILPIEFRRPAITALCKVMVSPVVTLFDTWSLYRTGNLYKLTHNGQVCFLRKVLNDNFDVSARRIKVIDGFQVNRLYIYTSAEQKPKYLGKQYLRPSTDFEDTGIDFIVLIPQGLHYNDADMRALIDYYRLASKRYTIQYE